MTYRFRSPAGFDLVRTTETLDYAAGIGFVVEALDTKRGAFFSSGVEYPDRYSRWDFGFFSPPLEFRAHARTLTATALSQRGERLLHILKPVLIGPEATTTVDSARALTLDIAEPARFFAEEERSQQPSVFSPLRRLVHAFQGFDDGFLGLYGAFGYDLIHQFERIEIKLAREPRCADLRVFLPDSIWLLDRRKESAERFEYEISDGRVSTEGAASEPFDPLPQSPAAVRAGEIGSDHTREDYAAKVEAARERIKVGDVFEVVLSHVFSADFEGAPSRLFQTFRSLNPSPYEFLCQFGTEQLVGTSPEMYIRVEGDRVESCPIAGTVRRGDNAMEDSERVRALYNSEKDEAELTMCTDVDRNDKARVCVPGTVRLLGRRTIERYAGLFHTVDHVEGRLRPGYDGIDAFLSHMWAVTLTGAPKKMAVQIIEDMESTPRRWYGAAVGGLLLNGSVNTGITIRTVHIEDGKARYRVGATLLWDSDGLEEAQETRTKATPFFRALAAQHAGGDAPARGAVARSANEATILMIDNEDSFVHTLADYFRQRGAEVRTYRSGVAFERIVEERPSLVVHSPGPGRPEDFGVPELVRGLAEAGIPQFGVCLGLQGIVEGFGGRIAVLDVPRHGKTWRIHHTGDRLFDGVPDPCEVGAYHSLIAVRDSVPEVLEVTSWTDDGLVMAVHHRALPIAAVQFHPESILSFAAEAGHTIIGNAITTLVEGAR